MVEFSRKIIEPGRLVYDDGDAAETVYLLRSGAVEIRVGTRSANPRLLGKVKKGEVFGEIALLENRSHGASAIAIEKSEVLEIPRREFLKRLNASDPVMRSVVNHLIARLLEVTGN